jgi:hypothetical protein
MARRAVRAIPNPQPLRIEAERERAGRKVGAANYFMALCRPFSAKLPGRGGAPAEGNDRDGSQIKA